MHHHCGKLSTSKEQHGDRETEKEKGGGFSRKEDNSKEKLLSYVLLEYQTIVQKICKLPL